MKNNNTKGFTLVELIVAMAIIGILSLILIPVLFGFVKDARRKAAIADARIIKTQIECALVEKLPKFDDEAVAFNKVLFYDQDTSKKNYRDRKYEIVGAFTNVSWVIYKTGGSNGGSKSQAVDRLIAGSLDDAFPGTFETGKSCNPMSYTTEDNNCAQFLKDNKVNFGLVVVYDTLGFVKMMQIYRKGVLVTYVNEEYLVNTDPKAHFVGTGTWDTIYVDSGDEAPEAYCQISLSNKQQKDNGDLGGWYTPKK